MQEKTKLNCGEIEGGSSQILPLKDSIPNQDAQRKK